MATAKKAAKRASVKRTGRSADVERPVWTTACPDWTTRIVDRLTLAPCPPLFPDQAEEALAVFDDLSLVDLGRKPDGTYHTFGETSAPWVRDFVGAVFGCYCDIPGHPDVGRRLIKDFMLLISKKNSKALALDTPIPTPSGWSTMGDLQVGDMIYGVDGKPCKVVATSPIYDDHDCYKIGFSNGESVVADAGHLWATRALADAPGSGKGNGGDRSSRKTRVRTTAEVVSTLRRTGDGAANHSMSMPAPIEGVEVELPVAPYTLGAWLGDGHVGNCKITTMDDEILDAIRADGWPVRFASNNGSRASTYSINDGDRSQSARNAGLASKLRSIGVLENKHIPQLYLRASVQQRTALLQGLMDTDGTIDKGGGCLSYTGTNLRLVEGVGELLSTFGIKHTMRTRKTPNGVAHTVQFYAARDVLPVFKLGRKLERMRVSTTNKNSPRSKSVQFVSAELVPSVPVKCIMVDSPDSQFLFGRTMLPTHNSTIAAGIMLTALILNWRDEAEFIILSPTKEVADNSFKPIAAAIKADPDLEAMFQVQTHIRTITHLGTRATLKVVAADSATVSGKKAVGVLIDELHEFGKIANASAMFTEATGGLMSRPEGFVIYLTTQSDKPPAGVFKEKLDYARAVRDGRVVDPQFYPVLYEFPPEMLKKELHLRPENFYITNPNIGRSVDEETLVRKIEEGRTTSKAKLLDVMAKHLNVEVGLALADDNWPGAEFWQSAAVAPQHRHTVKDIIERCEVITCGVDGGGLDDLLGVNIMGRESITGQWLSFEMAIAHPIVFERRKDIADRLRDFQNEGTLKVVDEMGDDADIVARMFKEVYDSGLLYMIGMDPNAIGALLDAFIEIGIPRDKIIGVSQGYKLAGNIKTTERKVAQGQLVHNGTGLMNWCVGNAKVKTKGNAIVITKEVSGTAKIDPLMALFCSVALMEENPPAQNQSLDFSQMQMMG